jgi:hypothetical protein
MEDTRKLLKKLWDWRGSMEHLRQSPPDDRKSVPSGATGDVTLNEAYRGLLARSGAEEFAQSEVKRDLQSAGLNHHPKPQILRLRSDALRSG